MNQRKALEFLESAWYYLREEHPEQVRAREIVMGALRRLMLELPIETLEYLEIPQIPTESVTN